MKIAKFAWAFILITSNALALDVPLTRFDLNKIFLKGEMKYWSFYTIMEDTKSRKKRKAYSKERRKAIRKYKNLKGFYKGSILLKNIEGTLSSKRDVGSVLKNCKKTDIFLHCDVSDYREDGSLKSSNHFIITRKKRYPHDTPEFYLKMANYHLPFIKSKFSISKPVALSDNYYVHSPRVRSFFGITKEQFQNRKIKIVAEPQKYYKRASRVLPNYLMPYQDIIFSPKYIYFIANNTSGPNGAHSVLATKYSGRTISTSTFYIEDEEKYVPTIDSLPWIYNKLIPGREEFNKIIGPYLEKDREFKSRK